MNGIIHKIFIAFCFSLLLQVFQNGYGAATYASEAPKDPILRIETGMHTAHIVKIGIDEKNRYLVTGSLDKTIRVWELATGRLIRTLRPPIGDGNEGMIHGVAISPDGKTIACGGRTWDEKNRSFNIYIFDWESGKLTKRISGIPAIILHLTYSRDGRYLAAALDGNKGLRVYQIPDYRAWAEDRAYNGPLKSADFDQQGRLVTVSMDGFIRLYDENFKLIAKEKTKKSNNPISVCFSADGSKIAVGFWDSARINVLSGKDLAYLYSPDTKGMGAKDFQSVAWSSDNKYLYAGSNVRPFYIRKWTVDEKGSYSHIDISAANSLSMHILPLRAGGIVFGSADSTFGVIDGTDKKVLYVVSAVANHRRSQQNFLTSSDGSEVGFSYEAEGKSPARFSLRDRTLTTGLKLIFAKSLSAPKLSAPGLNIQKWDYSTAPKLNSVPITLMPAEISRSLAISPDEKTFLIGTEWFLRLYDRDGREKWKVSTRLGTYCANYSGNGKIVLAALGDGTIHWYRLEDGKELLALFPHNDKKRWVLWTPSGYFDASPGAEELIGWHVNNGQDQPADFYPISKFRGAYYRPDVVAKVLETTDEKTAIKLANEESGRTKQEVIIQQMLPPVVKIISPADNTTLSSTRIILSYSIRTPSGEPVTSVKALVDGRPVPGQRGVQITPKGETLEMEVTIPERDCEISIIAENKYSASEPATVRLKWKGEIKGAEFVIKPKLYVLSIGVSKYQSEALTLDFAGKDAKDFAEAMKRQENGLYREVVIKILTDEKATKDEILDGLDWLRKETTSRDIAMVFLAGHGVNDQSGIYYYLPTNANTDKLMRTGVAFSDIKNTVASLAGKTVLFVDTCRAGRVMGKRRAVSDINAVINELSSAENGAVVFASSTSNQYSLENKAWGNGAFTKALVEGLNGKADYTGKGRITINMLDLYLSERVKELTHGQQTPTTTKPQTIADFPVALKK